MIVKVEFPSPGPRAVFSPNFLTWVSGHRLPHWWLVGDLLHHNHSDGTHFVWRLIGPRRGTDWIEGVWPD